MNTYTERISYLREFIKTKYKNPPSGLITVPSYMYEQYKNSSPAFLSDRIIHSPKRPNGLEAWRDFFDLI